MKSKLYFFKPNMNRELYQKVIKARLREDRITFAPDCPASLGADEMMSKPYNKCKGRDEKGNIRAN